MEPRKELKPFEDSEGRLLRDGCHFPSCYSSSQNRRLLSAPDDSMPDNVLIMSPDSSQCSDSIEHLERCLDEQQSLRRVLEKALGCNFHTSIVSNGIPIPKARSNAMPLLQCSSATISFLLLDCQNASCYSPAADLIEDIAVLEMEVTRLEQRLLSLYRTAFNHQLDSLSSAVTSQDSGSLMQGSGTVNQHAGLGPRTLADHLGASLADLLPETPNRLSEEIIRCISSIYCKLADPPLTQIGVSSASPASSLSSSSIFSPLDHCDNWSMQCNNDESLVNPFGVEGFKGKHGPYLGMLEISKLSLDDDTFNYATTMLQNFRSLIQRLEKVDPSTMKHEEKLAFWINIHNALAHLAYGIPHNKKIAYLSQKVRVYTPKNIFQELELAREEFIQVSMSIHKEKKIILPKVLYYYAKDASLDVWGILEIANDSLQEEAEKKCVERCLRERVSKSFKWAPYNAAFRYIMHRELLKG
ncbi:hypothetical protein ACLOJK_036602 [Asimina triloba]